MDIFDDEKRQAYGLLAFIYRKRKILIVGLLFGIMMGVALYKFSPDKFSSIGIVYPANPYTRDQLISNPQFGHDVEAERLMQLLESRSMMDKVVDTFELINYYDIDTLKPGWRGTLTTSYVSDVQFERSKYLSVVISAEMKDPELASEIVNYIIAEVNRYRREIYNENIKDELAYLKERRTQQRKKFWEIRKKIYSVKDTSDLDNIVENYLLKSAKEQYYPSDFIDNVEMADWLEQYKTEKHKFLEYDLAYKKALEVSKRPVLKDYVVDYGIPVYKPVSPTFAIIVLMGFIGLLVTLVIVWLLGSWQKIKKELGKSPSK